ncbi:unnamed protein product [Caenorhabditis auriculariae]|uniref:26S proteasome non-ATPase regulatory subunit 1 n=1 Tax=Caenorhabditis auriculariae TaxID=2777116 RepID=A0A8S1GRF2_9PELO|nr:unnamed protein product [Caenorhabditis auriculariae]
MNRMMLNIWRNRPGGPSNSSAFMRVLESPRYSYEQKQMVVEAFNEWDILNNTWFEVADSLPAIEDLFEDKKFAARNAAALLASKVYFCLEQYEKAMDWALHADEEFCLNPKPPLPVIGNKDEEYVNKMVEEALDSYKALHANGEENEPDQRLAKFINRIFDRHIQSGQLNYVLALAIETKRLDKIEAAITASSDPAAMMHVTMTTVVEGLFNPTFRSHVLFLLVILYQKRFATPDYLSIIHCFIRLNQPRDCADLLLKLAEDPETELLAYQIAFDLHENASHHFNTVVLDRLTPSDPWEANESIAPKLEPEEPTNLSSPHSEDSDAIDESVPNVEVDEKKPEVLEKSEAAGNQGNVTAPLVRIRSIISGLETTRNHMHFLIKNNHTDMLILKEMKDSVRTATSHNATLIANGLMHLGTTCDDFLRDNLDWISKATNWNKFNAVASLGLIHRGHEESAKKLLDPYLPKSTEGSDLYGYKEGGALFAYGLMHANRVVDDVIQYLKGHISHGMTAPIRHGACLGLGVAAMQTHNYDAYTVLHDALRQDETITGEAAGVAMGLVMAGSLNDRLCREMYRTIDETRHDKIQRGLRTGVALLAAGRQDDCEPYVADLINAKRNPVLRGAGVNMLAMAYVGTGNPSVVARLLDKVATDPNNDVKRFAATALGFVLCK